nr:DNA methyltransferase [Streptomyces sp. 769]
MDPFGGTGTTAAAAKVLGRVGISVDLSPAYTRTAASPSPTPSANGVARPAGEWGSSSPQSSNWSTLWWMARLRLTLS